MVKILNFFLAKWCRKYNKEKEEKQVQPPLPVMPSVKDVIERPLVSRDNYEAFREQQLSSLKTMKEEWVEVFQGQIPKDKYAIHLKFGEMVYEDLASVYLEGEHYQVHIDFRVNLYSRLLNRDLLASPNYCQEAVRQFSEDEFTNTIYQVKPSRLAVNIDLMSFGTSEAEELSHYVIVGQSYLLDLVIFSRFEEDVLIRVTKKEISLDGV